MNYDITAVQMLKIIKAVISGEKVNIASMDIDWDKLYALSEYHSLTNLIAYAIDDTVPKEIADKFAQHSSVAFARYMGYDYETKEICRNFEEKKISYMLLKGFIMKDYYPLPEMRTMCDVDILVKPEELALIETIMTERGYTNLKLERDDEVTYQKKPLFSYEMHVQMVSNSHTKIYDYYGDGWRFAKKESDYGYKMSDEDFFVFLIAHFAKHYRAAGVGVRPVIDIWLYLKKFKAKLDWLYIDAELDKLEMKAFAYNLLKLSDYWFENALCEDRIKDMSSYVLMSGIYGNVINNGRTKTMRNEQKASPITKYFNAVFLGYKSMADMFPNIKKCPPLIIYYWIKRLVVKIFDGSGTRYIEIQRETGAEKAQKTQQHFDDIGLK